MKRPGPEMSNRQQGMATLAISLTLLFLVTFITLYTANTTITEQQVSANQYRSDQKSHERWHKRTCRNRRCLFLRRFLYLFHRTYGFFSFFAFPKCG